MARTIVPEAEAILDREFGVLDKGFVRLVDYLGGDERIVQSARVSYGKGTKTFREDRGLIRYPMRNRHTSPFEQVVLTFHAKMPVFVARQWVRHRTARLNEISGRYSVMSDEFYLPSLEQVSYQSTTNRQGRGDPVPEEEAQRLIETMRLQQEQAYVGYENLLEAGVARELSRVNLPLSVYTEWYWQIDLNNLFHFLSLRLDEHAQYEIRKYAERMLEIAQAVCPCACEAFEDFVLYAETFSRNELLALRELAARGGDGRLEDLGREAGLNEREREQFVAKLQRRT